MDLWKINYSAVQNYGKKNIFLVSILIKKVREEKGKVGGLFERGRIFGKNIPILNQRKLRICAYYDIRNLIEIRGRGVKTIALPLDH